MIAGAGPIAMTSRTRPMRWVMAGLIGGLAAWSANGVYSRYETARAIEEAARAEALARLAEHAAFTDARGGREDRVVELGKGESLQSAIRRAGAPSADVRAVMTRVSSIVNTRAVRPGQRVEVFFENDGRAPRLTGVAFRSQPGAAVTVNRTFDGAFRAREVMMPLTFETSRIFTKIESSLYDSALGGGATDREIRQLADIFAYDVDFQRDIRRGDEFEMVFERFHDDLGDTVKTGDLLYVALEVRGVRKEFYRFKRPDGEVDYYDAKGRSARKFLMKTPVNGARLSSGFGVRRHPILGYSALHKGTDFAAAAGTPIMSAGDGVVVRAGWFGGYGNYVRVRHGDGYETAYAHMSRYAAGLRVGQRVRQGQVIGFVGSTGRSTGAHLHYEVLHKGAQVNPMRLKVRVGRNLDAKELAAFKLEKERIDAVRAPPAQQAERIEAKRPRAVLASAAPRAGDLRGAFR